VVRLLYGEMPPLCLSFWFHDLTLTDDYFVLTRISKKKKGGGSYLAAASG
jgi:hypothetical protein